MGDLAGFCAATYQRGVPVVQVPTTVVAQVDSAYGGKTGVDLPEAKNYVGAFHQPAAVLTDPTVLATLPVEELRAGYAEVVKTALIAGGGLWERVLALGHARAGGRQKTSQGLPPWSRTARGRSSPWWPRTSATRACGRRSTSGTRSRTRSSPPPGMGRSGTARRSPSGLLAALRVSERELGLDAGVRERVRDLIAANGLPATFEGPPTRRAARLTWTATRSAAARSATSCCCARPATWRSAPRRPTRCSWHAIEELRA